MNSEDLVYDAMTTGWDRIRGAFSDGSNTGFRVDVLLRARKFVEGKIYECGILSTITRSSFVDAYPLNAWFIEFFLEYLLNAYDFEDRYHEIHSKCYS